MTGVPVAATRRAPAGRPRRRHRAVRPRLALAAGFATAAIALFACYLRQSRTIPVGSDGASQALQAWDLLHGNLLLHGWWVTDVSFYTTELPQYGLIELARGLGANVIHVAGAMTYTLLVLAAALLARGRTAGPAGIARALVAAGIMLAPSLGPGTQTLLLSPDHTGTGVPLLLLFLLIDRGLAAGGQRTAAARWGVPLLAGLGLAATALADALTVFVAVIPLVLVGSLRLAGAARHGGWRPALAARREEAALVAAAVLAVPAELAAAALIRAHGGWQVNGLRTALASAGQLAGHARLAGEGLLELSGADVFAASGLAGTALAAVHLAGFALAVGGAAATARRFRGADLVEQVLLTGIAIDLAAYVAGVQAVNILSTREIAPVLPFAAVLAGRRLGGRLTASTVSTLSAAARTAVTAALGVVLALYGAGLGYAAAQPAVAPQYAGLASWLRAHHLTHGLSGYHQANIVTLATGGRVTLRAVTAGRDGRLAAYTWNASAAWYDPARQAATFLVLTGPGAPPAAGSAGLTAQQAAATFGRPARRYRYQAYRILVWPRGENLLARLRTSQSGLAPGSNKGGDSDAPALWDVHFWCIWSRDAAHDRQTLAATGTACKLKNRGGSRRRDSYLLTHLRTQMLGDLFDSPWKILIVAIVIIVLFGSRKLPDAARSLGRSMRILKTEVQSMHEDEAAPATVDAAPVRIQAPAAPLTPVTPVSADHQAQIDALSKQLADLQNTVKTTDNAEAK